MAIVAPQGEAEVARVRLENQRLEADNQRLRTILAAAQPHTAGAQVKAVVGIGGGDGADAAEQLAPGLVEVGLAAQ